MEEFRFAKKQIVKTFKENEAGSKVEDINRG